MPTICCRQPMQKWTTTSRHWNGWCSMPKPDFAVGGCCLNISDSLLNGSIAVHATTACIHLFQKFPCHRPRKNRENPFHLSLGEQNRSLYQGALPLYENMAKGKSLQ